MTFLKSVKITGVFVISPIIKYVDAICVLGVLGLLQCTVNM